jgi:hypothetical protein
MILMEDISLMFQYQIDECLIFSFFLKISIDLKFFFQIFNINLTFKLKIQD